VTLLRIDASIQGPRSASSALADLVVAESGAARPDETVVARHLGEQPLPSEAWALAIAGSFTPEAALLTTRGGSYGPGTPREGWDHSTAYLQRILADVWGADLTVIEREFTLVGVNPALDEFSSLAEQMKQAAEDAATQAGKALGTR
jgi:FMN-dependent NADH-azoreductase